MTVRIEVGKIYRNSLSTGGVGTTRFLIETQFNSTTFGGRAVNSNGAPIGSMYLFSSLGIPIGYQGHKTDAGFSWRLAEDKKAYEYRSLYDNLVDNSWLRVTPSVPRYIYATQKFLVREQGNNNTARVMDSEEFRALQAKS